MSLRPSAEISRATSADLLPVLSLLRDCRLPEVGIAEAIEHFFVARVGDQLLGCAGLELYGEQALLRSIAVQAAARASGLGRALVQRALGLAHERGVRELYLLTTTAPGFFERLAFAPVSRSAVPDSIASSWEFRSGCPQSALAMRLVLASSDAVAGPVATSLGEDPP
jgi:N-acetylglutamate synthase-like GNAT family acetyltransferase